MPPQRWCEWGMCMHTRTHALASHSGGPVANSPRSGIGRGLQLWISVLDSVVFLYRKFIFNLGSLLDSQHPVSWTHGSSKIVLAQFCCSSEEDKSFPCQHWAILLQFAIPWLSLEDHLKTGRKCSSPYTHEAGLFCHVIAAATKVERLPMCF